MMRKETKTLSVSTQHPHVSLFQGTAFGVGLKGNQEETDNVLGTTT